MKLKVYVIEMGFFHDLINWLIIPFFCGGMIFFVSVVIVAIILTIFFSINRLI